MPDALCVSMTHSDPNSNVAASTSRLCKPWTISESAIQFIAVCESGVLDGTYMGLPVVDGMILEVYNDSKGNPTVGLGHLVIASDHLKVGDKITVERARELAKKDFAESESAINRRINVPLFQREYDALVSIAINAGPGGGIAHLVDKVNTGECSTLSSYKKGIAHVVSNGVVRSRRASLKLETTTQLMEQATRRAIKEIIKEGILGIIKSSALLVALSALLPMHVTAQTINASNCFKHLGGGGFSDFDCYNDQSRKLEEDNKKIEVKIISVPGTTDSDRANLAKYMQVQDEAAKLCDLAVQFSYSWKIDSPPKNHVNMYDVMAARCHYTLRKQQNEFLHDLYSISTG